ncbi:AAA family ATPase [Kineosporia babensis]|uniref:Nuclease SbcCD subunit C n=1 Tax=Kineosporia babensis TaxID=499548 RepID=A0A9X1NFA3_9ACTN|nr:AAA family ATPase [Kineosporia babensis]MCD5312995.1 AAA family ATPase [Kineosporia babensis]
MSEELMSDVLIAMDADPDLPEKASYLVFGALQGDDELDQELDSETHERPARPEAAASVPAVRAFLSRIDVEGFRGVGAKARLDLMPGPGLTVISGRNGCGKSTFAEALEVALTSGSYRWKNRTGAVWTESWRNLHQKQTTGIRVQLAIEGQGVTTVGADWTPDASLSGLTSWVQRRGPGGTLGQKEAGLTSLGWVDELESFRPFLSYDELSALLSKPSDLYKALAPILGLQQIADAIQRLKDRAKALSTSKTLAADRLKVIKPQLDGHPDERAQQAFALVRKRAIDLEAVSALITGATPPDDQGVLSLLGRLSRLTSPEPQALAQAVADFKRAVATQAEIQKEAAGIGARRLALLQSALDIHAEDGDGDCPVCGSGRIDDSWAAKVRTELEQETELTRRINQTKAQYAAAIRQLNGLITQPPAELSSDVPSGLQASQIRAQKAWRSWVELKTPEDIAAAGPLLLEELSAALDVLRSQSLAEIESRQDIWQPLAVELGAWLAEARKAEEVQPKLAEVVAARDWLDGHEKELRERRMQPMATRTKEIWAQLRHESNVDIDNVVLKGSGNQRKVEFPASVDGEKTAGLAVMSQGELNALALAVFLPKATMADSPFGFVVIDDPVQAMDPAKVDGLARVLQAAAEKRQVVVLTHDDRLPEAVRRLDIEATLLQVHREANSVVAVREVTDPALYHLADARAVASDNNLDEVVRRRVIPELCRMSLEARCREVYFTRCFKAGRSRVEVEDVWSDARETSPRLALAVDLAPDQLTPWLNQRGHRRIALGVCTSAVHRGLEGDPHRAISQVEEMLRDLEKHRGN